MHRCRKHASRKAINDSTRSVKGFLRPKCCIQTPHGGSDVLSCLPVQRELQRANGGETGNGSAKSAAKESMPKEKGGRNTCFKLNSHVSSCKVHLAVSYCLLLRTSTYLLKRIINDNMAYLAPLLYPLQSILRINPTSRSNDWACCTCLHIHCNLLATSPLSTGALLCNL